jgi:hypothetical protein
MLYIFQLIYEIFIFKVNVIIAIFLLLQDERERALAQAMTNYPN